MRAGLKLEGGGLGRLAVDIEFASLQAFQQQLRLGETPVLDGEAQQVQACFARHSFRPSGLGEAPDKCRSGRGVEQGVGVEGLAVDIEAVDAQRRGGGQRAFVAECADGKGICGGSADSGKQSCAKQERESLVLLHGG